MKRRKNEFMNHLNGEIMNIEEILTKDIKVELSRIRLLLFVIAFVLILEFLL